jgi:predicted MFS family arabinose efflux permease
MRFLLEEPTLIRLTVITSLANVFGGFLYVSLPIFMREVAGAADTRVIALGYSVLGLGGLVGAAMASSIVARLHAGRVLLVSFALFTTLPAMALIATRSWLAFTVLAVVSATGTVAAVTVLTVRQRRTPRELLGRVAGITRLFIRLALPAGSLVAGLLVSALGFRSALMTMSLAGIIASIALATTSIRTETFDAFDDPAPSTTR